MSYRPAGVNQPYSECRRARGVPTSTRPHADRVLTHNWVCGCLHTRRIWFSDFLCVSSPVFSPFGCLEVVIKQPLLTPPTPRWCPTTSNKLRCCVTSGSPLVFCLHVAANSLHEQPTLLSLFVACSFNTSDALRCAVSAVHS